MAVKINKGSSLDRLNMTPMIDVVFNLLIFFMVVSKFSEEDRELDVQLPSASTAMPLTVKPKEIFINIDHNGRYFVDRREMDADEVETFLMRAARDNPVSQSVIIRADKRVPLDPVVKVMDLCNRARITDYQLTTEGKP